MTMREQGRDGGGAKNKEYDIKNNAGDPCFGTWGIHSCPSPSLAVRTQPITSFIRVVHLGQNQLTPPEQHAAMWYFLVHKLGAMGPYDHFFFVKFGFSEGGINLWYW
jgi:hypothetical protein